MIDEDFVDHDGRYICDADAPWTLDRGRAIHPAAVHERDDDQGDAYYAVYSCPYCSLRFKVEVPR